MKCLGRSILSVGFACALASLALPVAAAPVPGAPLPQPPHVSQREIGEPPHGGAEHREAAEEEGPKPVNWLDFSNKHQPPYVAALINFGILLFLYGYFGKKPIAAALVSRRERVAKQIEEAQRMKQEAETRSKQYAAKLGDLDQELVRTKTSLAEAGVGEKERIVREAEEKAVRMEKEAHFLLEQEARQTQLDLQRETVHAALHAAEDLLRTKITHADQERMAEDFLATLVPRARGAS
jgi:F-type H+-transporting ATPase subunit b